MVDQGVMVCKRSFGEGKPEGIRGNSTEAANLNISAIENRLQSS
jgi:hypothetical protein